MSKSTIVTCDCGCGVAAPSHSESGWFTLSQLSPDKRGNNAKLDRELQFSSLECLKKWAHKAALVLPGLQERAVGLHPRGRLLNEDVPGLYI